MAEEDARNAHEEAHSASFRGVWSLLALALLGTPPASGVLEVRSPDYGATVAVDRVPVGLVPVKPLPVAAGFHLVEVLLRGRPTWARLVYVAPGARLVLPVQLAPAPRVVAPAPGEAAPPPAPRFSVEARVAAEAAGTGAADETAALAVTQRWRVAGRNLGHPTLSAAVDVRATDLLAGQRFDLLQAAHGARRRVVAPHEARADWRPAGGELWLSGGRLLETAPGGWPLFLDGAWARWRPAAALSLGGFGGLRADPGRRRPEAAALAGFGAGVAPWGEHLALDGTWLFCDGPLVDAGLRGRAGGWRYAGGSRWHADRWLEGRAHTAWGHAALDLWAEVAAADLTTDPFRGPPLRPGLTTSPVPSWREVAAGLRLDPTDRLGLRAEVRARDGRAPPSPTRPALLVGEATLRWGPAGWGLGVEGLVLEADIGPPSGEPGVAHAVRGRLAADARVQRLRLVAGAGAARVVSQDPSTVRTAHVVPEGALAIEVELLRGLSVALEGWSEAVHPRLARGGGPLFGGTFDVRVR